jgi:hypothetical protein
MLTPCAHGSWGGAGARGLDALGGVCKGETAAVTFGPVDPSRQVEGLPARTQARRPAPRPARARSHANGGVALSPRPHHYHHHRRCHKLSSASTCCPNPPPSPPPTPQVQRPPAAQQRKDEQEHGQLQDPLGRERPPGFRAFSPTRRRLVPAHRLESHPPASRKGSTAGAARLRRGWWGVLTVCGGEGSAGQSTRVHRTACECECDAFPAAY